MVVVFAVVTTLVLLYSKGYVVDFRNRDLISTGGLFLKTVQFGTTVKVGADVERTTSAISRGVLITDLLPKRYEISVDKESYQSWKKVARIDESEVLEFRNIFLPPATVTPSAVFNARKQTDYRLSVLGGRAEVGLEVGKATDSFTVFIVNPETSTAAVNMIKVSQWLWDENSKAIIIGRVVDEKKIWYRLASISDPNAKEEQIRFRGLPSGFSAESVQPHPKNPGEIYFFAGGALFLQGRASVPAPISDQSEAYAVGQNHIYFISKTGFFVQSNLDGGDVKVLGRKGLFLDKDRPVKMLVSPVGDVAVIDSSGGLFIYRPNQDTELEMVTGNVVGIDFSDSGDRMLIWDDNRLYLYWLRDNALQPFDLAGTKKQIFYSDKQITRAFVNNEGAYAFFSTAEGIYMVDTDTRGGTNLYRLVEAPIKSFFFDKKRTTLFWVKDTVLMKALLK